LQILHNTGGKHIRRSHRISPLEALITQPEEIKAHLVMLEQLVIAKRAEALAFLPLVTILCMVARHKIIQVRPRQRIGAQGKVLVGAQVIDPQSFRPVIGTSRSLVEEECMYSEPILYTRSTSLVPGRFVATSKKLRFLSVSGGTEMGWNYQGRQVMDFIVCLNLSLLKRLFDRMENMERQN